MAGMASRADTSSLYLLVLFLAFSHLIISINAVPITRITRSLTHGTNAQLLVPMNTRFEDKAEKRWENIGDTNRRMSIELNDYPGSGANNRHTPKPQLGRVCVDC